MGEFHFLLRTMHQLPHNDVEASPTIVGAVDVCSIWVGFHFRMAVTIGLPISNPASALSYLSAPKISLSTCWVWRRPSLPGQLFSEQLHT